MGKILYMILVLGLMISCNTKQEPLTFIVKGEKEVETIDAENLELCLENKKEFKQQDAQIISGPEGMTMEIPLREDERVFQYIARESENGFTIILKRGVIAINYGEQKSRKKDTLIKSIAKELNAKAYTELEGYNKFETLYEIVN